MRIYKLRIAEEHGNSMGYEFFPSKHAAEKAKRAWLSESPEDRTATVSLVEITPTKTGIIAALNRHASHPDNG